MMDEGRHTHHRTAVDTFISNNQSRSGSRVIASHCKMLSMSSVVCRPLLGDIVQLGVRFKGCGA